MNVGTSDTVGSIIVGQNQVNNRSRPGSAAERSRRRRGRLMTLPRLASTLITTLTPKLYRNPRCTMSTSWRSRPSRATSSGSARAQVHLRDDRIIHSSGKAEQQADRRSMRHSRARPTAASDVDRPQRDAAQRRAPRSRSSRAASLITAAHHLVVYPARGPELDQREHQDDEESSHAERRGVAHPQTLECLLVDDTCTTKRVLLDGPPAVATKARREDLGGVDDAE